MRDLWQILDDKFPRRWNSPNPRKIRDLGTQNS